MKTDLEVAKEYGELISGLAEVENPETQRHVVNLIQNGFDPPLDLEAMKAEGLKKGK